MVKMNFYSMLLLLSMACAAFAQQVPQAAVYEISGSVSEMQSGAPDVIVFLCDGETGIPLSKDTMKPFIEGKRIQNADFNNLLTAVSGDRGAFAFKDVPAGRYRLIAQKWIGPYKGLFEINGSVIQLFGAAEVAVPSEEAQQVRLQTLGRGVAQLDMKVGNNETLLMLSTQPAEFDPILGFRCLGKSFMTNLIGANRMPYGRTTIVGLPSTPVHAFYFANDNNPGFATQIIEPQITGPIDNIPFVAGWSNGRHEPTEDLRPLMDLLIAQNIVVEDLLDLKGPDGKVNREAAEALQLDRLVTLPDGKWYRIGDIVAADNYRWLKSRGRGNE